MWRKLKEIVKQWKSEHRKWSRTIDSYKDYEKCSERIEAEANAHYKYKHPQDAMIMS